MNASGITGIVIAAGVGTSAVSYIVFRTIGIEVRRRHAEVGTAIFLQLGVIYAVFLAFVFGQALTSFVSADDSIDAECAALHGASILSRPLPQESRAKMAAALRAYVTAVVDDEWRTMKDSRQASPLATLREEQLLNTANTLDVRGDRDTQVQARIVSTLIEAHRSREERIFEAGQGIPNGLWVMILVYCGCLITLVFFSSLEYVLSHAILSGIFGGLNVLVLLAVFVLQYPFEGPFRLLPHTFEISQQKITATFNR